MPAKTAAESATGWAGDRVAVYRRGDERALALHVRYDDAPSAERAARAFVRGALGPEVEAPGPDPRLPQLRVTGEAATRALAAKDRYCGTRSLRGAQAVVRRGRDVVVTVGPYSRPGRQTGPTPDSCPRTIAWAESVLSGRP
jgi:hypothetical protein